MEVAILANIVSTIIGISVGAVAGFFGGVVDTVLMRFTDVMMSFPIILFAAFLAVVFEPGMAVLIFIIGFVSWFYLARIVRGEILSVKNREYVEAARSIGVRRSVILLRHLLPQVYGQIICTSLWASRPPCSTRRYSRFWASESSHPPQAGGT